MQASGAHGFKLRGVGLHREELHALAGYFFHMLDEALPHLRIDGRIFDRRICKDQHRGVDPLLGILGRIRNHVAVRIGEARIERLRGRSGQRQNARGQRAAYCGATAETDHPGTK
jgi:hypothetical protein